MLRVSKHSELFSASRYQTVYAGRKEVKKNENRDRIGRMVGVGVAERSGKREEQKD